MRRGIFGGSFDPVHLGHLILADSCREAAGLDRIVFMPAAVPPHKRDRQLTSPQQRIEMLKLATGGNEHFELSTLELDRGGVSYTVDTLRQLRERHLDDELFLLLGADSLRDFPTWREPGEICELATLLVCRRGGLPPLDFGVLGDLVPADRREYFARCQIEMPLIEISSTDLRQRAADGRSLRYRVPRAVEEYIRQQGLYKT
jgi:nicotinate-nucleotide adenylyltransferase